ncbi:MAG: hypothetical protein MJZ48_02770 [Paludibacteraceae bacterium]|nr:hypothetical protein [Paludibacteraceae bacterium]
MDKHIAVASDLQLTPYSNNAWKGKSGSIWYVARYNAICLLPSDIRSADILNKCGIHEREYEDALKNMIVQGYPAFVLRNYSPNFSPYYDDEEHHSISTFEFAEMSSMEEIYKFADKCNDVALDSPKKDSIVQEIESLKNLHRVFTKEELYEFASLDFHTIDTAVVLHIFHKIRTMLLTDDLSEQMGLPGRKILCHVEGFTYNESHFAQAYGRVPYLTIHRYVNDEYNIVIHNPNHAQFEYSFTHGYMGCLLNYCVYKRLVQDTMAIFSGPVDYNKLYALANLAISADDIHLDVDNKGELADNYINTLSPAVKKRLLSQPGCFSVPDEKVIEEIYRDNREWIKEDALRLYLPPLLHKMLMENCDGFLQYMRDKYPYLKEIEASYEDTQSRFLWPSYNTSVKEEDKIAFENQLRAICRSGKRDLTQSIKTYLNIKQKDGTVLRPTQQNTEWKILKQFGYPYVEKTYYNS